MKATANQYVCFLNCSVIRPNTWFKTLIFLDVNSFNKVVWKVASTSKYSGWYQQSSRPCGGEDR